MIQYIDDIALSGKTILLRVDFNVPLSPDGTVTDDTRIRQVLPTIKRLLDGKNKLILVSHLGKPDGRDPKLSLRPVIEALKIHLPAYAVRLVEDFEKLTPPLAFAGNEILLLENIRYYKGEKDNDPVFAKQLASLGDTYVNDAFSVCHRKDASVVGVPKLLPSYGGLQLKKEVGILNKLLKDPGKPFVAVLGGSKISTKLPLLKKLVTIADNILLGGGLADNFLSAKGYQIGQSIVEPDQIPAAKELLEMYPDIFILPTDVVVGQKANPSAPSSVKSIGDISPTDAIFDIGPETQRAFAIAIANAKTTIWNGPLGFFEQEQYRNGSDSIFAAITSNPHTTSIIGGGDTIAVTHGKEGVGKITHISTGGGAMLTFIADGTLPGIEALETTS
jgi:phosphoglycerate kinase